MRFNPWVRKSPWRRAWQPTPVFLPEESHGQRSLAGYRPWGREESDTTEVTHAHTHTPMPLFTWRAWPHSAHSLAKCHPVMSFTAIKMWLNARMWAQTPTEVTTHRMSECFDSVLLSVEEDNVWSILTTYSLGHHLGSEVREEQEMGHKRGAHSLDRRQDRVPRALRHTTPPPLHGHD